MATELMYTHGSLRYQLTLLLPAQYPFGPFLAGSYCMHTQWHIGCSGFSYKEWKDRFYPKGLAAGKWFEYYCQHFNCVELNVTFYRFPQVSTLQGWHRRSPEGFLFAAKAPRNITHFKKFRDAHQEVADFYQVLQSGLAEKLGAVLFQTPPSFSYSETNLANIISHLNPEMTNVVEFRNESWWRPEVWEQLQAHNIVVSGTSYPGLPDTLPGPQPTAYYRLHGVPHLYHSPYTEAYVRKVAGMLAGAQNAFVFFDNTASGAALANAQYLQQFTHAS